MATEPPKKSIHSLIVDTGPLIKNAVSISTLINAAEEIFTTPAIISEIKDAATRSRVQTTLMPFLKVRNPNPASYDAVIAFSKKTGDYAALSRQDLGLLALAYEVHCERNGGPWGLREAPKQPVKIRPGERKAVVEGEQREGERPTDQDEQKEDTNEVSTVSQEQVTASKPKRVHKKKEKKRLAKLEAEASQGTQDHQQGEVGNSAEAEHVTSTTETLTEETAAPESNLGGRQPTETVAEPDLEAGEKESSTLDHTKQEVNEATTGGVRLNTQEEATAETTSSETQEIQQVAPRTETHEDVPTEQSTQETFDSTQSSENLSHDLSTLNISTPPSPPETDEEHDSDDDWITPDNLHDHQAADAGLLPNNAQTSTESAAQLDVATMTIDFAMQNVLLQMNLHLISTNMQRIKTINSKVLRCHACFLIERDTSKQFCPRCGGANLLRVNCSTNAKGEFRLHLSKNYTYNKRGDKYSIPKPIAGTANTKWSGIGGGQGGWGKDLVLSEDQKEYTRQVEEKKKAAKDLMDQDYLPGILSGDRSGGRAGGRLKVGAGKNVNSKRRL